MPTHEGVLLDLARARDADLGTTLRRVLQADAATLAVERVSYWSYAADRTEIVCEELFKRADGAFERGVRLQAARYPEYFRALDASRTIAADDAQTDTRTREFTDGYLVPLGITSMMDTPVRLEGVLVGVVCHEHVGQARRWTARDQDFANSIAQLVSLALEADQLRRAEAALRRSEAKNRALLGAIPDMILQMNREGTFTDFKPAKRFSPAAAPVDFLGRNIREVLPQIASETLARLDQALRTGSALPFEYQLDEEGRRRDYEARIEPSADEEAIVVVRDVTERKELEEQLRQAVKMEAVGRLAGGIAHDFNNLLTAISGYAELLRQNLRDEHALADLAEIERAARRAATLTRQLLAFSRKQVLDPKVIDLNAVVGSTERMLRRLIGEHIELDLALAPDSAHMRADAGQIEQVLVNLVVNARDAMPDGGRIRIGTSRVDLGAADVRARVGLSPGPHVVLTVEDTGHGMDADTLTRAFEPFFTTKGIGQGTGLGLSTVYGIIQQSGGSIGVDSEPGRGTAFRIHLPRVEHAADRDAQGEPGGTAPGIETVMVVEDEDFVRQLVCRILRASGYRVLEAGSGAEAMVLAESHSGPIHLLVTDVVMPRMSGRELVDRMLPRWPDLKVLYMSGYAHDAVVQHGIRGEGRAFLQKPFTAESLAHKVRESLDAATPALASRRA